MEPQNTAPGPEEKRDSFRDRLAALRDEIAILPDDKRAELEELADATERLHDQMRKATTQAVAQLGNLQLGIKYLLFDLEATKRENQELRGTQK
ncbi:MAG: hypothetical protein COW73_05910 [Nitrospirae bacterium CG18_big_fil_WC_8_21_14_2_50_70_55]|nr:hypothetical protein [Deltaproteobacteria bacterium]OIP63937.1 MAG: hypothetical protein AUK30_07560 [Nitrospirae bacterium CG2_30_70_394]PIQ05383.1 MAG: hypothetical protein COW73_05910 [Nitrospirae bacterium CG18_big_fil_WC_8_21_14_2_50_70_55]PIU80054.1 MAG: hypothetical protein COS73_01320 [Nitrospirae bacterium CG06_land_8_20_14_3_00_70_43]PIW83504.1 MAG: hypothetical protein COZ96_02975 [Nitrospirae bacterium CG_4_8_14_3_um_filter_70_85]PIX83517.1 MAG: hypothetical protein COZ33_05045 